MSAKRSGITKEIGLEPTQLTSFFLLLLLNEYLYRI